MPTASELGLPRALELSDWAGLGYTVLSKATGQLHGYYDPFRKRLFALKDLPDRIALYGVLVRQGLWLAQEKSSWDWNTLDPYTSALKPIEGLGSDDDLGPMLVDGRVFLVLEGKACLFDPENGSREPLRFADDTDLPIRWLSNAFPTDQPLGGSTPIVVAVTRSDEIKLGLDLCQARRRVLDLHLCRREHETPVRNA
jgi:hypothetical protein